MTPSEILDAAARLIESHPRPMGCCFAIEKVCREETKSAWAWAQEYFEASRPAGTDPEAFWLGELSEENRPARARQLRSAAEMARKEGR